MNILVPDSWLREFLTTKATPQQIKEYLSLCGPSVERMHKENGEVIYDIEVTGNRPDSMSILGIAREAAAILPRFGIAAKLKADPYTLQKGSTLGRVEPSRTKTLTIKTDSVLNPRWTSVIMDNIKVGPSPNWLKNRLETTGIRSLNTIVDVTNYIMRAFGQPVHAFDYDQVLPKNGVRTMILRASKKGERIITLDGKTHSLLGDDIVIEDGSGRLIDLCGIMGAQNSSVKSSTKTIVLFMQTYEPTHIRKTSMSRACRTEAAGLFEKGLDPELVLPSVLKGIELIAQVAGGKVASKIYDIYPKPHNPYVVSVTKEKLTTYLGVSISDKEIVNILAPLGFKPILTKSSVSSQIPSYRRDVKIDVDLIEEVARIYGYHNIKPKLPSTEPPVTQLDSTLTWEEEIKIRLRDWGYTETYTYSMISEELMDIFGLDKTKAYKISNPLSSEWVYMRPTLTPSLLSCLRNNIDLKDELKLFELSMIYTYRPNDLPLENPSLVVIWKGDAFKEAKGLAEALFLLFGIPFPSYDARESSHLTWYTHKALKLGDYGAFGVVSPIVLTQLGIKEQVTRLYLDLSLLLRDANVSKQYIPIPKYPPFYEDFTFVVPPKTPISSMMEALKSSDPLIVDVSLLAQYKDTQTYHVTYQSQEKNLTAKDILPIHNKLLTIIENTFQARLKE